MPMFAAADAGLFCMGWFLLMGVIVACVGGFRLWLMIHRPEVYAEIQRGENDRRRAMQERRKGANSAVFSIGTMLLGALPQGPVSRTERREAFGGASMTHEPLMHDCAVAGSQAVTELITFLREEEREAFAQEAYRVFRALLDSFRS